MIGDTRDKVIAFIQNQQKDRFLAVNNTVEDKKIVSGQFPDLIFYQKTDQAKARILFTMKVENGGELVDSVSQWKDLANSPYVFYVVVPVRKLDDAKKLINATGIKAKCAWYEQDADGKITKVTYE